MKKTIKRVLEIIIILTITYLYGIISGVTVQIMQWLKIINVSNLQRFPFWQEKVILASNHPSVIDPFILSALFFRGYLFHPFKNSPYNVTNVRIFYDHWYWFWLRPLLVFIEEGNRREEAGAFFRIKKLLDCGKKVILFPEGGRTLNGKSFLRSRKGKRVRTFNQGIGLLAVKTEALVVPVWIEGSDRVFPTTSDGLYPKLNLRETVSIRIGKPLRFQRFRGSSSIKKEEVTQKIADALLELADLRG